MAAEPVAAQAVEPARPRAEASPARPRPLKRTVTDPGRSAPKQAQLFPSPVIRFEEFTTVEQASDERQYQSVPQAAQPLRQAERKAAPRRRIIPGQQALFPPPPPTEQPLGRRRPEPAPRYSQYRVAQPIHRIMAAFMDMGLIVMGMIPVWVFFRAAGGDLLPGKTGMPVHIAVACLVAFFYKSLWLLAEKDSPGMLWVNLRLVNFDNQPPTRSQRAWRLVGACLSVASAGLGLIWALADEEKLTWHDHISKTFPTPYSREE